MVVAAALLIALQAQEPLFSGLGNYHRHISTTSPAAQRYFDQGLNFLYAFNHDEAIRSFREAARLDPACPMALWGIATANGPHINNPFVDPMHNKEAWDAIMKAKSLESRTTPVERALIEATTRRFANKAPDSRAGLDKAYADAMRGVWRSFPRDADVGALFAESMMDLRPWDLWRQDGSPQPGTLEIVATLKASIRDNRVHPMANHLYIHAVEASPHPEDATASADLLRTLQPALGHNVHMPSHTYVRTGRWQDSIDANDRAIAADRAYRMTRAKLGFYRIYMAHNRHMLGFSAMMIGQSKKAIQAIDQMVAEMPPDWLKENAMFVDGFISMPIEVRKRFGQWDAVLAAPEPPEWFPIARTMRHGARAIAYAAKGMTDEAEMERALFSEARARVPAQAGFGNNSAAAVLDIAEHLQNGEVLIAEKDAQGAIKELKAAVAAEDQLRYDEPPDWILPARHTLGALLMKLGDYAAAADVYRRDLKVWPNNGWSLYGLSASLEKLGNVAEAKPVKSQFAKVWAKADMSISSSCMCLPGK